MACVYSGIVPFEHAFEGFSHPAVITVASVLVISQALQSSGIVELFLRYLALSLTSTVCSLDAEYILIEICVVEAGVRKYLRSRH